MQKTISYRKHIREVNANYTRTRKETTTYLKRRAVKIVLREVRTQPDHAQYLLAHFDRLLGEIDAEE